MFAQVRRGWRLTFEFRQRRPILRLILAVPLSIAICPMLSYLLARFVEPGSGCSISVCLRPAFCCWRRMFVVRAAAGCKIYLGRVGTGGGVGAAAIGSMVDLQIGDKLYPRLSLTITPYAPP